MNTKILINKFIFLQKFFNLLNQRTFNIDLNYFIKNFSWNFLSYFISIISTLIFTYILANFFAENEVGIYRYVFSWYGVIAGFMFSGIASVLTISIAKGYENSLEKAFFYKSIFSVFGFLFSIFIAFYYLYFNNLTLFYSFLILSFAIPLLEVSALYNSYLTGKEDFKKIAKISIFTKFVSLFGILFVTFILQIKTAISIIFFTLFLMSIFQFVYIFYLYKKNKIEDKTKNKIEDKNLFNYSLNLSLMGFIFMLGQQADKIILFKFFGSFALAGYWIATTIPIEVSRFIGQIFSIYFPKLVKQDSKNKILHSQFKNKFLKNIFFASFLLFVLSLFYYFISPILFKLIFPKYLEYIFYSQMFFFSLIFTPFSFLWQYFLAKENTKLMYIFHFGDPILQIFLYYIFIFVFNFGILGIIIAYIIKQLLSSLFIVGNFIKN